MDAENRSRLPNSLPTPHSDQISCEALCQVSGSSESQLGVDFDFDCLSALGVTRTISSPPLRFRGLSISNGFVIELEKAGKDLGLALEISRKWIVHSTLETEKSVNFFKVDDSIKKLMDTYLKQSSSKFRTFYGMFVHHSRQ